MSRNFTVVCMGEAGEGGGGWHVSAPHHTNVRKMSRVCGAISSLVFKVSPLKFKFPFFKALF